VAVCNCLRRRTIRWQRGSGVLCFTVNRAYRGLFRLQSPRNGKLSGGASHKPQTKCRRFQFSHSPPDRYRQIPMMESNRGPAAAATNCAQASGQQVERATRIFRTEAGLPRHPHGGIPSRPALNGEKASGFWPGAPGRRSIKRTRECLLAAPRTTEIDATPTRREQRNKAQGGQKGPQHIVTKEGPRRCGRRAPPTTARIYGALVR
jgi:hypothetical protein